MATLKESRRWDQEEVHLLIYLVKEKYEFLRGVLFNAKTKPMVDARRSNIVCAINSLGCNSPFSR